MSSTPILRILVAAGVAVTGVAMFFLLLGGLPLDVALSGAYPTPLTATPEPPTSTPPPLTATPEPPTTTPVSSTETPQPPTATPGLVKQRLVAVSDDGRGPDGVGLAGWEIDIFAGDGCTGTPIISGLTVRSDVGFADYSVRLPPDDYSAAETLQPGWERVGQAFCQNFNPSARPIIFRNRMTRTGDVTGDGATDSRDATVVLQYTARLATLEDIPDFFRGDVNLDESTDALDAQLILQHDAGLLDSLPVGP